MEIFGFKVPNPVELAVDTFMADRQQRRQREDQVSAENRALSQTYQQAQNVPKMEMASRIEGAKAAGLHPLAALGVNVGNYSATVSSPSITPIQGKIDNRADTVSDLEKAQTQTELQRARAEKINADLLQLQYDKAQANLASQAGNRPVTSGLLDLVPNTVTRSIAGQPFQTAGNGPSQDNFTVTDAWTGQPRTHKMPSKEYGARLENMGELWQAIGSVPYGLDMMYQKYLQSPREWLSQAMFNTMTSKNPSASPWKSNRTTYQERR